MSEFKFACPVCGQHITADSGSSGGQLECPTCFQKIIVPQAPSSDDPKFILSASQVGKPRPTASNGAGLEPVPAPNRYPVWITVALLMMLAATGAAMFFLRDKIFRATPHEDPLARKQPAPEVKAPPPVVHAVPTNINWTLELTNADIPAATVAGSIHGSGFLCERATLQGGALTLRQGKGPSELGVTVYLFAQQGEELGNKSVEVPPDRSPPIPRVTLRWKDDQQKSKSLHIKSGYALKVAFGQPANGRMPGRIYLALPDDDKSFVAGTFDAEIRRPSPPKPSAPKPTG